MKNIFSYIIFSFLAVVFLLILVFLNLNTTNIISFLERLFVAGIFITSCLFGISSAMYPNWWRKILHNKNNASDSKSGKIKRQFKGHHPDCNLFNNHVIVIRNKTKCAGCFGLIIGSVISIFLMIFYLLIPPSQHLIIWYFILIIGLVIIPLIYLEIIFSKRNKIIHIISNIVFIVGFFCITISIFEITRNFIYAILAIIFCFLWLDTRIRLSKHQHSRICAFCKQSCKSF